MCKCKDCANSADMHRNPSAPYPGAPLRCLRKNAGGYLADVWPDACCPDWSPRRDKLDERAERLTVLVETFLDPKNRKDYIRALLAKWAQEDREAGK